MSTQAADRGQRAVQRMAAATVVRLARARPQDRGIAAVAALVAAHRQLSPELLLHPSRCRAEAAAARQLAMYLAHVMLGRSYSAIGRFFGRDRTTVAYACASIEDLREQPAFDDDVAALEDSLAMFAALSRWEGDSNVG